MIPVMHQRVAIGCDRPLATANHESHSAMIRVLIYLVIVALLAFGAVWLAERPGDVVITWQGERVETSVMVLMAAAAAVAVAAVLLWSIARAIVGSPDAVSRFLRNRRGVRAFQ